MQKLGGTVLMLREEERREETSGGVYGGLRHDPRICDTWTWILIEVRIPLCCCAINVIE